MAAFVVVGRAADICLVSRGCGERQDELVAVASLGVTIDRPNSFEAFWLMVSW